MLFFGAHNQEKHQRITLPKMLLQKPTKNFCDRFSARETQKYYHTLN